MSKLEINIPEIEFKKDFTIIYKGREERDGEITEPIQEINTSKEEFLRKLRYFKQKAKEIEITDEIYIHDKYSPRIFSKFIDSIHTNKLEVDENEYIIISELSHKYEFHELSQEIEQFLQKRPDVEDLVNESKFDELDPIKEEKLSQNLDICLQNDNFSRFPIQILVRILNSPKKVLKNHHLLFNFIKKIVNQNKPNEEEENLQVLLSCLDYMQMSDDELDYVFNNDNFTTVFNLKNSKERMKTFKEENQLNVKRITTLEEKFSYLINSFDSKIQKLEQRNELQEKNLEKYRKENENLQKSLKNQEELLRNINQVNQEQQDLQKKFVAQEKNLSKYRKENEELQKSLKNQQIIMQNLDQLNQTQDELKDKIFKQEQVLSKYRKENEELQKSLKNQETIMKLYDDLFKLTGKITASVDSNQIIRGQIKITDKMNILDKSRSKYILNTNKSPKIGEMSYEEGTEIKQLTEEIQFIKSAGTYFLHAILVDTQGSIEELVSQPLTTRGANFEFSYTGKVQSVTLIAGKYKIEVWGAEGGENDGGRVYSGRYKGTAGKGGYSVGTLTLAKETKLFIHVGGSSKNSSGGWNGGGSAGSPAAGGGGGSDISLYGEEGSSNWDNNRHLYSRIIVAGGGGGSSHTNYPDWGFGNGGGLSGDGCGSGNVNGGTQTGGYKFGVDESNTQAHNSGGGGGWYGGYAYNIPNGYWGRGGGGGSGFVYNSTTATQYPSGCKLDSSFYLTNTATISGKDEIPNVSGTGKEIGHRGNGYAKITPL